jgi:hypothetical protein
VFVASFDDLIDEQKVQGRVWTEVSFMVMTLFNNARMDVRIPRVVAPVRT